MPSESSLPSLELPEQYVPSLVQSWQPCSTRPASYSKVVSLSPNESESTSSSSMSPRSEYYRLMYACLQEKFDYVQASTDRLRDRLYHVKKEVTYLKRMKRVLIRRLARYGESYSYAPLEIPDNVDIEDPIVKKRKERRERERERKEAQRAARRAQQAATDEKPPTNTDSVAEVQPAPPQPPTSTSEQSATEQIPLDSGQEPSTSQPS
ncbi:hypothetical protein Y032_0277g1117 [Ancylostoma ceylanicum]|nr:hypothetical protein Y032_0277g1117 [Ancylostoma ceylanicum]